MQLATIRFCYIWCLVYCVYQVKRDSFEGANFAKLNSKCPSVGKAAFWMHQIEPRAKYFSAIYAETINVMIVVACVSCFMVNLKWNAKPLYLINLFGLPHRWMQIKFIRTHFPFETIHSWNAYTIDKQPNVPVFPPNLGTFSWKEAIIESVFTTIFNYTVHRWQNSFIFHSEYSFTVGTDEPKI